MNSTKKSVLTYLPITVSIAIIFFQIYLSSEKELSKWKGGGFGMYTEVHYNNYEVWISKQKVSIESLKRQNQSIKEQIDRCKLWPNSIELEKLALMIRDKNGNEPVIIEVWKPKISAEDMTYSRTLINRVKIK